MKKLSYIALLLLSCIFSCQDIKTTNSNNQISPISKLQDKVVLKNLEIDQKWYGTYRIRFEYGKIGGINAGWDLEILINKNQIIASGNGYQIGFKDELTATAEGNKLVLKHKKNIDGYTLGEDMNPEFILIEDNGLFYIQSEWIDSDIITKPEKKGFKITKEN
ncbi:hypothetical protein SAMN05443633_12226 [Chryseobacterium arachidis]|uniref:Uncharacterized protein n=1 Tax=Chryseobacterium arachidis TaxID=1416778 RepID=A0A1M5MHK0_9FLAO|nr:hypothetical protein [Chryseobacterium arachidis]SHG76627.1 hypothetical protein SAMN05443633_12226 [Chryseobacterium arachidis]